MTTPQATSSQPYRLTIKRGFLALFIMFASQTLVGLGISFGLKFVQVDTQMIGLISVLVGGTITLIWVWTDIRRFGPSFFTSNWTAKKHCQSQPNGNAGISIVNCHALSSLDL